jgi:hypothetical protein
MTRAASDVNIVQVETDAHKTMVKALWQEYLTWADDMNDQEFGIQEIPPYPESEVPAEYHRHWVFMELSNLTEATHG